MGVNSLTSSAWLASRAVFAAANPVVEIEEQFGVHLPPLLVYPLTVVAALLAFLALLKPLNPVGQWALAPVRHRLRRPDADELHRRSQRKSFALYLCSDLHLVNSREDWRDERFADLEAEVEVEGRVRRWRWIGRFPTRTTGLRRERSLARALERSEEQIITLEGEPGAGKSVALRHLALTLATRAAESAQPGVIPLYVNLRTFHPPQRPVTPEHVNEFIYEALAQVKDRNVVAFLEQEYQAGLNDGRWLLLLDSFDEIPDILGATDCDETVREYAEAIYQFVHAMKSCRSIVASREFRGPDLRIPRFRIMPMRPAHQRVLVRNSGIRPAAQNEVLGAVLAPDAEWAQLGANPMFLNMLCAYIRDAHIMPESRHAVFEQYFAARLASDAERIRTRFQVEIGTVRTVAELAAFTMAVRSDLGLEPERSALIDALAPDSEELEHTVLGRVLDALEFAKLARSSSHGPADTATFSFAHRRFQEYFATCQALRTPEAVTPSMLLFDGQWRETAVTMLQTRPADDLAALLDTGSTWLEAVLGAVADDPAAGSFSWPPGALHLLGILANGLGDVPGPSARRVRHLAGSLLSDAWERGRGHDRVWALEVILAADPATAQRILEAAFAQPSTFVQAAAYRSAGRLTDPPDAVSAGIRQALISLAVDGRLYAQREQVRARVGRLRTDTQAANTLSVLRVIPGLSVTLSVLVPLALAAAAPRYWAVSVAAAVLGALLESRNIAIVLHLKPRESRPIAMLATRPLIARASAQPSPVASFVVRMGAMVVLFVAGSMLAKSSAGAGMVVAASATQVAPLFLVIAAVHPLEHGCVGPLRALTIGIPLGFRHLPAHLSVGAALRRGTARARAVRPSRDLAWDFVKPFLPPCVMLALGGVGLWLYHHQSHRAGVIYGTVIGACLAVPCLAEAGFALRRWLAARARVRAVRGRDAAFAVGELAAALGAVRFKWEMTATLRAIACADALPTPDAVDLVADFVLLADAKRRDGGTAVRTQMYTWLQRADPADLARLLELVTYEGADEIIRFSDVQERRTCFLPLTQQIGARLR